MKIIIPHNHTNLDQGCDFIFQTASALLNKKHHVTIILRKHPISLFSYIWLSIVKKQTKEQRFIREKLKYLNDHALKIEHPLSIFPKLNAKKKGWTTKIQERLNLYSSLFIILKMNPNVIWSFDHQNFDVFKKISTHYFTLYDCVDHFMSLDKETNKIIKIQEQELIEYSRLVVVNSQTLHKKFTNMGIATTLIEAQGFDINSFKTQTSPPDWFSLLCKDSKKKVTFVGSLSHRVDYSLLISIIKANSNVLFLLPSEIFTWEKPKQKKMLIKNVSLLKTLSNIYWIPKISRKEISLITKISDVTIIPYDISLDFNKFSYPMKLFEYFFAQKPVISTPILELTLPKFKGLVYTAETTTEWQTLLDDLLEKPWPESKKNRQRKIAELNSWSNKVDAIVNKIKKCS